MIKDYGHVYFKNILLYQSYVRCQEYVNTLSDNPEQPPSIATFDMCDNLVFAVFVPETISRLCGAVILDWPEDGFAGCLENIRVNVEGQFSIEFGSVFHFGLLFDNLHLFSEQEQIDWTLRMNQLFEGLNGSFMNFVEFYKAFFMTQFFGGDSESYTKYMDHMKYTFIIYFDIEYHEMDDYGPSFMNAYMDFARFYREFYEDLIEEIKKRKKVGVA